MYSIHRLDYVAGILRSRLVPVIGLRGLRDTKWLRLPCQYINYPINFFKCVYVMKCNNETVQYRIKYETSLRNVEAAMETYR